MATVLFLWLALGAAFDLLAMWAIVSTENAHRRQFNEEARAMGSGYRTSMMTLWELLEETPWYDHVVIFLFPPAGLLRASMEWER